MFGYFQSPAEEHEEVAVGEEVSVFTVSKRRRVGEAAGAWRRCYYFCLFHYHDYLSIFYISFWRGIILRVENQELSSAFYTEIDGGGGPVSFFFFSLRCL